MGARFRIIKCVFGYELNFMFINLEQVLISFAGHMHLAIFAPLVSFFDEVIPIIPSPSVMIATGAIASLQQYAVWGLIFLSIMGALGKTLGASVIYLVVDKVEDLFAGKIAKFFGITHEQIEGFGRRLSQSWKDYVILIVLRALPIVPSSLISIGGGLLKIRFRLFFITTFIGSIIRDFIYIYIGFTGTKIAISFFQTHATNAESFIMLTAVIAIIIGLGWLYFRQKKKVNLESDI